MNTEEHRGAQSGGPGIARRSPVGDACAPAVPERWNHVSGEVIGCAMEVHTHLGRGLSERLYEEALVYEMAQRGMSFHRQAEFRVRYKDVLLPAQRLDLVVEGLLVVELKAVESVAPASVNAKPSGRHQAAMRTKKRRFPATSLMRPERYSQLPTRNTARAIGTADIASPSQNDRPADRTRMPSSAITTA